jgi:short-subunit dehydrogenase
MKIDTSRVIWITGASSGIGRALALELARRARLILSGRDAIRLAEVGRGCTELAASAESIRVLPFDLAEPPAVASAVPAACALFGRVDILVLCGGVSQRAEFAETSLDTMDRLLEVNYRAAVALIKGCLPAMRAQGSGQIVAVTSLAGKVGAPLRTGYCAAKHALQGFCNALRAELLPQGIAVTVVVPGFVRTEISHNALTGNGARHGRLDALQASGISPKTCARDILRAIERGKAEIKTGFDLKSWLALGVSHVSIGLYTRLIAGSEIG